MLTYEEICRGVCDEASVQMGVKRDKVSAASRLLRDLHCDSMDYLELLMKIEERFGFAFPHRREQDSIYKTIFTRAEFTLGDIAEYVYINQGRRPLLNISARRQRRASPPPAPLPGAAFTHLGGAHRPRAGEGIYDALDARRFRRVRDGIVSVEIPAALVQFQNDNSPRAQHLDTFLIDIEPVSTTAYARFLNSIGSVCDEVLREWFLLAPDDHRQQCQVLQRTDAGWQPLPGTETFPMVLVSWHGAVAYARWAHGKSFVSADALDEVFLPSEWQWEYAARGRSPQAFPWGSAKPTDASANFAQHQRGARYSSAAEMPIMPVNIERGVSPLGPRHMAGNVWQWCSNLYGQHPAVRAERGGSWIGPAALCRSDYRRGRTDWARGRCLGFRCATRTLA